MRTGTMTARSRTCWEIVFTAFEAPSVSNFFKRSLCE